MNVLDYVQRTVWKSSKTGKDYGMKDFTRSVFFLQEFYM